MIHTNADIEIEITQTILKYKNDINMLKDIRNIYDEKVEMLVGGFATSMYDTIDEQIKFCEDCIKNLEKLRK